MIRHWQSKDGSVWSSDTAPRPGPERWTEVRVVPLNAIVIERSELPEVVVDHAGLSANAGDAPTYVTPSCTAVRARAYALGSLAIAEFLNAHPPVDEAQVSALTALLYRLQNAPAPDAARLIALDLIATGKVTITTDGGAS